MESMTGVHVVRARPLYLGYSLRRCKWANKASKMRVCLTM